MAANITKIAWRNLGRNRRRTLITGLALTVGTSLCVLSYGLIDGLSRDLVRSLTRYDLGHIQAHEKEYPRRRALNLTLPTPQKTLARIASTKGVIGASMRVYGNALVSADHKSEGAQLVGVDPNREVKVTILHERLVDGRYLDGEPTPWPKGQKLSEGEKKKDQALTAQAEDDALAELDALPSIGEEKKAAISPATDASANRRDTLELARKISPAPSRSPRVIMGQGLAKRLKVKKGDKIFAIGYTVDGLTSEVYFEVVGIYHTGTELYDRNRIYLHIADLQRYMGLAGRAHEIAAIVAESAQASKIAGIIQGQESNPETTIRDWETIRPDIKNLLELNEASTLITIFIIFIVATLGVVNTMLMAVFERTREFGMLKALGMSGGRVLWMVVVETTFLVIAGAMVGTLVGTGFNLYFAHYGIELTSRGDGFSMGGLGIDPVLRAKLTWRGAIMPTAVLSLSCFIGSFYPAWRAARKAPASGMREV
jgi:lipoprotein-releasing system permease protein